MIKKENNPTAKENLTELINKERRLSLSFLAKISAFIFIKAVPKTAPKTPTIEDKESRALKVP